MKPLVIGVSGINANDNPGPGAGVARSLKEDRELGARIVGLAYDALEPGIYMDWLFDRTYTLPYPSAGGEEFVERLLEVQAECGMDWVIPNLDVELPLYIRFADTLANAGIRTILPSMKQFRLRGKDKLTQVATAIEVDVPDTIVVSSEDELCTACQRLGLPVMVKGAFYQAHRAYTQLEAVAKFRAVAAEWGYPVIVQQRVEGDELNLVGVGDGHGGLLGAVAMKKIATTSLGKVWSAVSLKNPRLEQTAERFAQRMKWRGPFELECIDDPRTGRLYLIEINPRFPAWSYFATGVGVNLPARMIRRALGLPIGERPDYQAGQFFMRYTSEIVTDLERFRTVMTQGAAR
jgi:carbamoyl-phosphate synthase large subunit